MKPPFTLGMLVLCLKQRKISIDVILAPYFFNLQIPKIYFHAIFY